MASALMKAHRVFPVLLLLLGLQQYCVVAQDCVYTLYIRTGREISGGTNAVISVTLYDPEGDALQIDDIVAWGGLMGAGHDYFERGNVDIFAGRAACLGTPVICALNLTSDGSGSHPAWYVNYVETTVTGAQLGCNNHEFVIDQWIANDRSPYRLYATRDDCNSTLLRPNPNSDAASFQTYRSPDDVPARL